MLETCLALHTVFTLESCEEPNVAIAYIRPFFALRCTPRHIINTEKTYLVAKHINLSLRASRNEYMSANYVICTLVFRVTSASNHPS